jgi:hypothetical protein
MTLKRKVDYEILERIEDSLSQLHEKVDIQSTTLAVTCKQVDIHDKALNGNGRQGLVSDVVDIKKEMARQKGYIAAIGTVVTVAANFFWHFVKGGKP